RPPLPAHPDPRPHDRGDWPRRRPGLRRPCPPPRDSANRHAANQAKAAGATGGPPRGPTASGGGSGEKRKTGEPAAQKDIFLVAGGFLPHGIDVGVDEFGARLHRLVEKFLGSFLSVDAENAVHGGVLPSTPSPSSIRMTGPRHRRRRQQSGSAATEDST